MENTTNNSNQEITQEIKPQAQAATPPTAKPKWFKRIHINWKWTIITIVILAVLGLGYYFKGIFVAAIVDGHVISRVSIVKQLEKQSGQSALEQKIDAQLIDDAAAKKNITVSADDINNEMKTFDSQLSQQGENIDSFLSQQGITLDDFKSQIATELKLEKLLGDKISVSDAEISQYIKDNNVTIPQGQDATYKSEVSDTIKQQKLSDQAPDFLDSLRAAAKIHTFVNY